jgi:hypothetical protein
MLVLTTAMENELYAMGHNGLDVQDAERYLRRYGASPRGEMMQDGLDIFYRGRHGEPMFEESAENG